VPAGRQSSLRSRHCVLVCGRPVLPGTGSGLTPHGPTVIYPRAILGQPYITGCTLGGVSASEHLPQHHPRMTLSRLASHCAFCQLSLPPTGLRARALARFPWCSLQWSSRQVVHPALPCRFLDLLLKQTPMVTDRWDLLRLSERSCCGRLYPLRDPNPLPLA
jgi:hypothetical protein